MPNLSSRRPRRSSIHRAVQVAAVLLFAVAGTIAAKADDAPKRTLSLSGIGEVRVAPDLGHITIGVVSEAQSARAALTQNTAAMSTVLAALKSRNIADKDLQTSNFSLNPRYVRDNRNRDLPPRIAGYRVSNQITVTVRRLQEMGELMDVAVSLGSNRINAIAFSLSKRGKHMDQARRLATRDAIRKAKLYAEEAGVKLGPVSTMTEVVHYAPQPRFGRAMAMEARAAPVPVAPGEQALKVQVNMTWQLQ